MNRVVRIVVIVAAVLLLLLAGLFAYLRFVFDPNDFRERIGALVEAQTGRKFSIDCELGLSVFPWIGVEIGAARLGNAEGFSERPFASIRAAQVRALLMPLLSGRVEVDRVTLDGLELSLERNRRGLGNWSDLARAGAEIEAGKAETAAPAARPGMAPTALALGGLTLRDYSQESIPFQTVLTLGTGLTWGISRSLDLNADVTWERTRQDGVASLEVLRAGIGLTLKR